MKISLLITVLLFSKLFFGQNTPYLSTFGYGSKDLVIEELNKTIKKSKKGNFEASYNESINGDTLIFYAKNKVEEFRVNYTFNLPPLEGYKQKEYCGFQEYSFDCVSCAKQHMKGILNTFKFRKTLEGNYLSEYPYKTELEITKTPGNKIFFRFRYVDKSKQEYKTLYDSLPKIDINAL